MILVFTDEMTNSIRFEIYSKEFDDYSSEANEYKLESTEQALLELSGVEVSDFEYICIALYYRTDEQYMSLLEQLPYAYIQNATAKEHHIKGFGVYSDYNEITCLVQEPYNKYHFIDCNIAVTLSLSEYNEYPDITMDITAENSKVIFCNLDLGFFTNIENFTIKPVTLATHMFNHLGAFSRLNSLNVSVTSMGSLLEFHSFEDRRVYKYDGTFTTSQPHFKHIKNTQPVLKDMSCSYNSCDSQGIIIRTEGTSVYVDIPLHLASTYNAFVELCTFVFYACLDFPCHYPTEKLLVGAFYKIAHECKDISTKGINLDTDLTEILSVLESLSVDDCTIEYQIVNYSLICTNNECNKKEEQLRDLISNISVNTPDIVSPYDYNARINIINYKGSLTEETCKTLLHSFFNLHLIFTDSDIEMREGEFFIKESKSDFCQFTFNSSNVVCYITQETKLEQLQTDLFQFNDDSSFTYIIPTEQYIITLSKDNNNIHRGLYTPYLPQLFDNVMSGDFTRFITVQEF